VSSMARDLVRALGEERMAEARQRRLVGEARRSRRAQRAQRRDERRDERLNRRRGERQETGRRWRGVRPGTRTQLTTVPLPAAEDVARELAHLLGQVADRVAESGTESEKEAAHALSDAARLHAPGAADALVDWEGAEAARLRAFGVLHGVVLHVLGAEDCAWLLDRLRPPGDSPAAGRVA
jgi:hypothetical protein